LKRFLDAGRLALFFLRPILMNPKKKKLRKKKSLLAFTMGRSAPWSYRRGRASGQCGHGDLAWPGVSFSEMASAVTFFSSDCCWTPVFSMWGCARLVKVQGSEEITQA